MKAQRIFPTGISAALVLLSAMLFVREVASLDIPPEVEKKAVQLTKINADVERSFITSCGKCHKTPDPVKPASLKHDCSTGFSKDDLGRVQGYMTNVRAGKELYETYCDRCHTLIEPESHDFDYWSRNICTSDSCMVKKRLSKDEEQQLLLYLSSHAKKN